MVNPFAFIKTLRQRFTTEGSFHVRLLLSSGATISAVAGLAIIFLVMALRDHRVDTMRTRTLEMVRLTGKADNDLAGLANGHRGFLLTGQEAYRNRVDSDHAELTKRLGELRKIVGQDNHHQTRVWAAGKLIDSWLKQFAMPEIDARRRNGMIAQGAPPTSLSLGLPLIEKAHNELESLENEVQKTFKTHTPDRNWVDISFQVLVFTPKLQRAVAELEKAERDYLLTGEPKALEAYRRADSDFNASHGHLLVLLAENEQQTALLKKIRRGVERWEREIAVPELTEKQRGGNVSALLARASGKQILDEAWASLDGFEQNEMDIYRNVSRRAGIERALKALGLGGLCAFAIAVLIASGVYSFRAYQKHLYKIETAEARTRSIIETSLDGILTMDQQGTVLSMNPAAEAMFASSSATIVGQSLSKLIPQRLFLHDLVQTGRGSMMAMGTRQGFYPFPIEISLSETDVAGQRQFVALIRDVTERKRSEETLKNIGLGVTSSTGEEFVRSLVKQLSKALETDLAFIIETVVEGDPKVCSMAIAENGHIRRKANVDLTNTVCEEVLKKGFRAYSRAVLEQFPFDEMLKQLRAESFVAMPLTDHKGKPLGLMGVIDRKPMDNLQIAESTLQIFAARAGAEIERKRFEEDLAAEKERLAVTLRSIGDGFITIDNEGKILLMNVVAEKLTGWASDQAINKPLHQIFHILNERTRKPCQATLQRIVDSGSLTASQSHTILVSREGNERVIETSAAPIRDVQNRKGGVVLVFRDITEKQRMEEERHKAEKLESLGVAAGGIAHDFNNLLTAIIGNISLTMLSLDDEELTARLTAAKKASMRAQELAGQLLTFSKGGAPVKKTASISQLVQETVQFTLRGTNISSTFHLPDDLWSADVDASQISQAIGNMTVNAEQAMPAGGTLHVSAENAEIDGKAAEEAGELSSLQPGRYVKISLRDEGVGISEENVEKIFDPYFSTKPKGSGLGLATSYSIVKSHDGLITVESTPGAGAIFHIYLPATNLRQATGKKKQPDASAGSKGRIMIMDDEDEIRMLVNFALTPLGYEVTEAPNAETAIQLYTESMNANKKFDAVIMDLTIPGGMGGGEAIKKLKLIDPKIRAIVSSGYSSDPIMSRHLDYGFCAMLPKPYEVTALGQVVDEVVSRSDDDEMAEAGLALNEA